MNKVSLPFLLLFHCAIVLCVCGGGGGGVWGGVVLVSLHAVKWQAGILLLSVIEVPLPTASVPK